MSDRRCHEVEGLIPELALGVAPGPERASALDHVTRCERCRGQLDDTAKTVDALMLLAPETEPPAGFETRVLQSMKEPRRGVRRPALALAAAACLLAASLVGLAILRSSTPEVTATPLLSAELTAASGQSAGPPAGRVFGYQGQPAWVFMTVGDIPPQNYRVTLVGDDGTVWPVGVCRVRDGYESWGTVVDVPLSNVDRVLMRGDDGTSFTGTFD